MEILDFKAKLTQIRSYFDQAFAMSPKIYAQIAYDDPYVQPLILSALSSQFPKDSYQLIEDPSELSSADSAFLQILPYESLDFERALESSSKHLINAYVIRKALIRKHYLSKTVQEWVTKNPSTILAKCVKPSEHFELDYAEFLDDALVEAFELRESLDKNEEKEPQDREWWILKPGMSDRGQGIKLFSTFSDLESIFEDWEAERPDSDDEDEDGGDARSDASAGIPNQEKDDKDYIITSQLRHFIAQPYIHPPLLLSPTSSSDSPAEPKFKFHLRTYVLARGALSVYLYRPILALFAASPYTPPWSDADDLRAHLTNTCIQESSTREGSVCAFWNLPDTLPGHPAAENWKEQTFQKLCKITADLFEAAARGQSIHFQPLPNAFEVFGLDFMLDESLKPYLLEVNAFPDFKQTGEELSGIVGGLWKDVIKEVVGGFFEGVHPLPGNEDNGDLVKVLDVDLGRR